MKRFTFALCLSALISNGLYAQFDLNNTINKAKGEINNVTGGQGGKKNLSNDEIIQGLKEALSQGSRNAGGSASKVDGFYKNPQIKIPFPPQAQSMESKLREMGMGDQVDKFVLTLNRAAEDASKQAEPIFVDAVKKMTITDGLKILNGGNDAATNYLRNTTGAQLTTVFLPIVRASIQKVEVTKYWNPLITEYNRIPFVDKQNPDLEVYVTQKALEGLFWLISQEELKIRQDPAARVTDILKKVFGN